MLKKIQIFSLKEDNFFGFLKEIELDFKGRDIDESSYFSYNSNHYVVFEDKGTLTTCLSLFVFDKNGKFLKDFYLENLGLSIARASMMSDVLPKVEKISPTTFLIPLSYGGYSIKNAIFDAENLKILETLKMDNFKKMYSYIPTSKTTVSSHFKKV